MEAPAVVRHDPALDALIAPDAAVERLAGGFGFLEGPVWHPGGHLLFSDLGQDARRRFTPGAGVTVERSPNARGNGMTLERELWLLVCEHVTSALVRERADGTREVVASHWQGVELNSPNDVVVRSDGTIFFTDPWYGRKAAHGLERPRALGFQGVYRVDPDGALHLLADDFEMPNGLCFSPDETLLYVDDTPRAQVRVFDVEPDGSLANGRLLREGIGKGSGDPEGVVDGVKCDAGGNVWVTGPGGVWVLDPAGRHLGTVLVPEPPANLAWGGGDAGGGDGGGDLRTLYLTARTSLYTVRTLVGPARLPHHAP